MVKQAVCAGLNHQAGRHQFLHHHAGDRRAHGQLRIDRHTLALRVVDLLLRDAEDLQACRSFSTSDCASL